MEKSYTVVITPEAEQNMRERASYIVKASGLKVTTRRYITNLRKFCLALSSFPHRHVRRDDLRPDLHLTNYLGTTVIAYDVHEDTEKVRILAIFHSSQNYEPLLKKDKA